MKNRDLKKILDKLYNKYSHKFSSKDPVWILHGFSDEKDIETAGLITSCYTYGQVDQINRFIHRFLESVNHKVHEFTSNYSEQKDKKYLKNLYYRFNSADDLSLLIKNIRLCIEESGSLKNVFLNKYRQEDKNILNALKHFTASLNRIKSDKRSYRYLIPSPEDNSACKRLNLYLRWMIRKDETDTGIWGDKADKSKLIMPVDTHIYRISTRLGLVKRKSCDMKFALELTEKLRTFDKNDPVKYDFALCHTGIEKEIDSYLSNG